MLGLRAQMQAACAFSARVPEGVVVCRRVLVREPRSGSFFLSRRGRAWCSRYTTS